MRKTSIGSFKASLLLLGLSACGPDAGENGAAVADKAVPGPVAAAAPVASPRQTPSLVLEGEGLRLAGSSLAFGTPEAATIEAVTEALGRPPAERGANDECGGGGLKFAAWKDEITLWFDSDGFVGWDSKGVLETAGGIGLGSSRSELGALDGLEVQESTLGTEFLAGGIGGILDSSKPGAKVIHLWGGSTCVFR